jgi:hypothetical protein
LKLGDNWIAFVARAMIFGTPRAMTVAEIEKVIAQFAIAARLAVKAGFKGVEVHAGRTYDRLSILMVSQALTKGHRWISSFSIYVILKQYAHRRVRRFPR